MSVRSVVAAFHGLRHARDVDTPRRPARRVPEGPRVWFAVERSFSEAIGA
jgi:hypothetical protein